jgi:hypothetical protein
MYSPKIKEELIHKLYYIARARQVPMTHLVNQIIFEAIKNIEIEKQTVSETIESTIEKKIYLIKGGTER